jgi:8-oxo-dGTP pyrophosphatase MutT (NUDIX family)
MGSKTMTLKEIRKTIRQIIEERSNMKKSAGVIIVKKDVASDWLFLALVKEDGKYDIAKGIVEEGESYLQTAVREAKEESNISLIDKDFIWGYSSTTYGRGTAFVAMSNTDPFVTPNPESGIMEHVDAKWVSFEEMIENTVDFLKPAVVWAFRRIHGE